MAIPTLITRRRSLVGLSASALTMGLPIATQAGAAVPVPLPELIANSRMALVATPREAVSNWEGAGSSRRIVTYSRLEVHQPMHGHHPDSSQLYVRTLGGRVGDIGQVVHGEAELTLNQASVFFLHDIESELFRVTAMAQGHYPLLRDGEGVDRLTTSPKLADFVVQDPHCAVVKLRGKTVSAAERLLASEVERSK